MASIPASLYSSELHRQLQALADRYAARAEYEENGRRWERNDAEDIEALTEKMIQRCLAFDTDLCDACDGLDELDYLKELALKLDAKRKLMRLRS